MAVSAGRVHQHYTEVITKTTASGRVQQQYIEGITKGTSAGRLQQTYLEVLAFATPAGRIYQHYVEILAAPPTTGTDIDADNVLSLTQLVELSKSLGLPADNTITLTQTTNLSQGFIVESELELDHEAIGFLSLNTEVESVLTFTQTINLGHDRAVSQTLTLTQVAVGNVDREFEIEHTLTFVDEARRVIDETVEDELDLTFEVDVIRARSFSSSSPVTLTQVVAVEATFERLVNHGMTLVQSATKSIYRNVSATNTLSLTGVAVGILTKKTHNELALDHEAEYTAGKHVRHFLELTQVCFPSPVYNRTLFSVFIPGQAVAVSITVRPFASNTLTLAHSAVGFAVKNTSSTLALAQSAVGINAKPTSNGIFIVQQVALTRSIGQEVNDTLPLDQDVVAQVSKSVIGQSYLGFNQFARGTRVLSETVEDELDLAQDLVRDRTIANLSQTLTLTQTAVGTKLVNATAASSLTFTQSLSVSRDIVREIAHTLTFLNSFEKYTGIAGRPTVTVPNVQVVKVDSNCTVILQNGSLVIVLPCPEFNDSEGGTGTINIKRTMAGSKRVYQKKSPTSRLNYQFVIDRKKAIELRNFILNSNTAFLNMQNWKGELWAVQMTNSPFTFGEDAAWLGSPGGNRSSITLEFEGVRLN